MNITFFSMAGVLGMLVDSGCEHLPELRPLAATSDASLLRDIPEEIPRIVGRLVRRWWTNHGLPECLRRLKAQKLRLGVEILPSFY
jgi:hypothetical protein